MQDHPENHINTDGTNVLSAEVAINEHMIERIVIRRLEQLHNPVHSAEVKNEVHQYEAYLTSDPARSHVTFFHRYGDRALRCLERGLRAISMKLEALEKEEVDDDTRPDAGQGDPLP